MRFTLTLALALACLAPAARGAESAVHWTSKYVLATTTADRQLAPILRGIGEDAELRDQDMCDLLAEVLVGLKRERLVAEESTPLFLRVLTNVPFAARYRDVIKGLEKSINKKVAVVYLAPYHRKFDRLAADQYVAGTIDLKALQRGFAQAALATKPSMTQAQALADMPATATMEDMFALAGKPALVVSRDIRLSEVVGIELRQLWFYYRGIGRITFDFKHESGWHPHYFIADPLAFEDLMPYRAMAADLGLPDDPTLAMIQLLSGNAPAIKVSANATYRRGDPSPEYLDTAAELLLQRYAGITNVDADSYGWICNVLSDFGGARYANVLHTVEEKTTDPKLKRVAGQDIKRREGEPFAPYRAGSISLTEQSRKYPTLYPGMTLARGIL